MINELSIKIKICDRLYPMKVGVGEEARVRKMTQQLNQRIENYQQQFGIQDYQDLLAMVAFDCLIDLQQAQEGSQTFVVQKVADLTQHIQKVLSS